MNLDAMSMWALGLAAASDPIPAIPRTIFSGTLRLMIELGLAMILLAMGLSLARMLRGPELADRIVSGDLIALQVLGLVLLLTVRLESATFIDVALTVAIIGFVTTLALAQYLVATKGKEPA